MRYAFSNLGQGLRRNLSMHLAVILTLFVSLTLVGFGALVRQETKLTVRDLGSQLEIAVFLCRDGDTSPSCLRGVDQAQKDALVTVIEDNPQVATYRYESKAEAFRKYQELYDSEAASILTEKDMNESYWITLKDPDEYEGIVSAVQGLDGVSSVRDQRDAVEPVLAIMDELRIGSLVFAGVLVVIALMLVANTIRLAAFARRKEMAIMRLVGASGLYIALPFVLESLVAAVAGVLLAGGALAGFVHFGVQGHYEQLLTFLPWVGWDDYVVAMVVVLIVAPIVSIVPTLLLTRKYIKV